MQMKKTFRNILVITALSPLLIQCATQDEVQRLQYQLQVVNKRLSDMQKSTVGDIQKQQAASANQIDTLETEILTLKSQLDETNMQNRLLKEQNDALQSNIGNVAKEEAQRREEALAKIAEEQRAKETRIAELNEKLKAQEESLQAIQDARVREAERRAQDAKAKAEAAKARALAATPSSSSNGEVVHIESDQSKRIVSEGTEATTPAASRPEPEKQPTVAPAPKPVTPAAPDSSKVVDTTPETPAKPVATANAPATSADSILASADQLYQQKQYSKAYNEYEQVAMANPTSDDGISAGYMMGECLYAQKEYDKAILQYQKIISQNSSNPKAASATLKQAMAFEQLADNETARMIYKKIVNHYGSSPEAKIAKEKLGNL